MQTESLMLYLCSREMEAFFFFLRISWGREVWRFCSARCKMFARPLQDVRTFAANSSHARCKPCWPGSLFPMAHLIVPDGSATLYRHLNESSFFHTSSIRTDSRWRSGSRGSCRRRACCSSRSCPCRKARGGRCPGRSAPPGSPDRSAGRSPCPEPVPGRGP